MSEEHNSTEPLTNPELFDLYVGHILARLYEKVPVPIDFDPVPPDHGSDTWTARDPKVLAWQATMAWLKDEGYIRIKVSDMDGTHYGVVPTEKALFALKSVPEALQPQEPRKTIGSRLLEVMGTTVSDARRQAVSVTITELFKKGMQFWDSGPGP